MRVNRMGMAALAVALLAVACSAAPKPANVTAGDGDLAAGSDGAIVAGSSDEGSAPTSSDGDPSTPDAPGDPDLGGAPAPGDPNIGGGTTTTSTPPGGSNGFRSTLFSGANNTVGITKDRIVLCAHAALTYGAAFNTSADDLNVYWTDVNDKGGIFGRKVDVYYENDNYKSEDAITAATACQEKYHPFMLLGGIGFDQIPAVRSWAEEHKVLYFHHTATVNGSEGKKYSFTSLPTTEKMGEMFAELAATMFKGKTVGIVKRDSVNWEPGIDGFKRIAAAHNVKIVYEKKVVVNQGSYLQEIIDLQNEGAQVVWPWLNALETYTFIQQAKAQEFNPQFMVFPFNIETQQLGDQALNPPIVGLLMHNAYSYGDYTGEFAKYADDMKLFEAQYKKWRPNADIKGLGSDLIFLNWSAQKAFHEILLRCGPDCTRNRIVEITHDFKGSTTSSACQADFTRADSAGGHRGGFQVSVMKAYRSPSGKVNFRNIKTCVEHLL